LGRRRDCPNLGRTEAVEVTQRPLAFVERKQLCYHFTTRALLHTCIVPFSGPWVCDYHRTQEGEVLATTQGGLVLQTAHGVMSLPYVMLSCQNVDMSQPQQMPQQ